MSSEHFDAVIVGSGFGGSVTAYRLAQRGLRVCLLERGKRYPPHSFPRSPFQMRNNFWRPEQGQFGLFEIWSFRDLCSLVASGLGGGSLIYAGVTMRKDPRTFVTEDPSGGYQPWPFTYGDLEPHYENVERMLNAQPYPFAHAPYSDTGKTIALKTAAQGGGGVWSLPNLAISFANRDQPATPGAAIREDTPNLHGRPRTTCCLCGECNLGCNFGSKNSLDYTYLSAAHRHGATIMTQCDVRAFRLGLRGGYVVEYIDYRDVPDRLPGQVPPRQTVTADRLILAAGTFGSIRLLLQNRGAFPAISRQLGTRFSGNGDLLMFLSKSHRGDSGQAPWELDGSNGPVITCSVRFPDELEGGNGRGFYLQDGGYPAFLTWLIETNHPPELLRRTLRLLLHMAKGRLGFGHDTDVGASIVSFLGACDFAASSLPLLAMGRDTPHGTLSLARDGHLALDWQAHRSAAYTARVRSAAQEMAAALHATLRPNPLWYLRRSITAHPLGGCPMGRNEHEGVVDPFGAVFNYPGLYVTDGSLLPGPVGPNPSLTIAALADRCAARMVESERPKSTAFVCGTKRARIPPVFG